MEELRALEREQQNVQLGFSLYADYESQQFEGTDTRLETLGFYPYLNYSDWSLSVDIPWQRVHGDFFVSGDSLNLPQRCIQLAALTAQQRQTLITRFPALQSTVDTCAAQFNLLSQSQAAEISGIGDIGFNLRWAKAHGVRETWYTQITVGYTDDNADFENGLGSGTQDVLLEALLNAELGKGSYSAFLGRSMPIGGALESGYQGYNYGGIDLNWRLTDYLKWGVSWDFQQTAIAGGNSVRFAGTYLNWRLHKQWQASLRYKNYLDADDYPEYSVKGGLTYYF